MFKSYFYQESERHENICESGERVYVWYSYNPHLVLLDVESEVFTLELYAAASAFMATGKSIIDEGHNQVDICGVKLEIRQIVEQNEGDYNYRIKDIEVIDIDTLTPIQIGEPSTNLFFVEQKHYLAETEDDFKMVYSLISCESEEVFKEIYKQKCEKASKKDESVMFNGLFFCDEDAYSMNRHKKIDIHYPKMTKVN